MTDLTGISTALAAQLGLTAQLWGYILGTVVAVILTFVFVWAMGNRNGENFMLIISALVTATVMDVMIGWWDLWVPVFILVVLVIIYLGPLGNSLRTGGGV